MMIRETSRVDYGNSWVGLMGQFKKRELKMFQLKKRVGIKQVKQKGYFPDHS